MSLPAKATYKCDFDVEMFACAPFPEIVITSGGSECSNLRDFHVSGMQ